MSELGDDAWVEALDRSARHVEVAPDVAIVVQQELTDTGVTWHVVVAGGAVRAVAGRHPSPDVSLSWTAADAGAVQRGEIAALAIFQSGRLRIGGDVGRLPEAAAALAALPGVRTGH